MYKNFKKSVIVIKYYVIARTLGCVVISFPLFLAACGDDSSSGSANNGDEIAEDFMFTPEELEELGIGIYESADKLGKCDSENELETVYVKADSSFYVCDEGKWNNDFFVEPDIEILESKDDLGECNEENEGQMFKVPRDTIFDTYACEDGEWISDFGGNSGEPVDPTTVVKGTFTDERDGMTYKTVKIGDQTWMAENLNYKSENSFCYEDNDEYCEQYGRLYAPAVAEKICPEGWQLPEIVEWNTLYKNMGNNLYIGLTDPYEFNMSLDGYRDRGVYKYMSRSVGYWVGSGNWLIDVRALNNGSKKKKDNYPWINVDAVKSNDAMYMRCIKK